jgi:hypothetical protein
MCQQGKDSPSCCVCIIKILGRLATINFIISLPPRNFHFLPACTMFVNHFLGKGHHDVLVSQICLPR